MASPKLITHPLYAAFSETWRRANDVFEGAGGFLDEQRPYLIPHPREWLDHSVKSATGGMEPNPSPVRPSPKLLMRRRLARYENVAAAIIDTVTGALFQKSPTRTFTTPNEDIAEWWQNVDGRGNDINTFLHESWIAAAVFGHVAIVVEKADAEATTAADAKGPRLCRYTPLDMIDWLLDEYGDITAVKLLEAAPRDSFDVRMVQNDYRVRVVDEDKWAVYDKGGKQVDGDVHGFSRLPVVLLYGKRRPTLPVIGKAVIGDPQLHIDAYNIISEVRELLRNQTFGMLNIPVGKDGNAETEKSAIGQQSGTSSVLFSTLDAKYISPDPANVTMYHEHSDRLVRMIYRLASCPWESDSKDAEAVGSLQLKRQDMHNTLVKYVGELQRTEDALLELAYEAFYGDQAEARMEADAVTVAYPDSFELPDFEAIAKAAGAVIGLDVGETATKEIKKRVTFAYLNDLSVEDRDAITQEIDTVPVLNEQEKQQQLLDAATTRMAKPMKGAA